jgi:hypothetical protein
MNSEQKLKYDTSWQKIKKGLDLNLALFNWFFFLECLKLAKNVSICRFS